MSVGRFLIKFVGVHSRLPGYSPAVISMESTFINVKRPSVTALHSKMNSVLPVLPALCVCSCVSVCHRFLSDL